jgi:hypothetical protein
MKTWTYGSFPWSGSRNAWIRIINVNGASRLSKYRFFFGAIQIISCRDWWPWAKAGYITMSRRKSNNQWGGGIAAQHAPKNPSAKIRWKSPRLEFFKSIRLIDYLPKGQTINAVYYSSLVVQLKDILKENAAGSSQKSSCACMTMPRLTGHLQPKRNWPTWASSVLITHPILRIWPRRTTTYSLDWKKQLKVCHFSSDAEVVAVAETWSDGQLSNSFFLSGLQ